MFETDASRDETSRKMTRRVFVLGSVAAAGMLAVAAKLRPGLEASTAVHGTPGEVTVISFTDDGTSLGQQRVAKMVKTDGEWRRQLGANSFDIARESDTEMPYSGNTWREHGNGLYRCICCATALFSSKAKFESGTGWPSFWAPLAKQNIVEKSDTSLGDVRTEAQCVRCEAHLGHIFSDGPEPTGLRYCMNSASLRFIRA